MEEVSEQHDGTPSPINGLPTETIGEIFCHYVASDIPAWRLTLICNRWRRIAPSTPALWTYIIVGTNRSKNDAKWSFFGKNKGTRGRAAVCLNVDEFRDAVSMAGSLPLHIELCFGSLKKLGEWEEILISLINEVFCSSITVAFRPSFPFHPQQGTRDGYIIL